jgi:hypothetical protein
LTLRAYFVIIVALLHRAARQRRRTTILQLFLNGFDDSNSVDSDRVE